MKLFSTVIALFSRVAVLLPRRIDAQSNWEPSLELFAADSDPALASDYGFGWQVAISGDTALIGSKRSGQYIINTQEHMPGLGSARIFDLTTGLQTHVLVIDDGENVGSEYYGYTVALDGDTALVGVYRDSDYKGRAFVFVHDSVMDMWNQQGMLELGLQDLKVQVALSGQTAVVGCGAWNGGIGKAMVFVRSGITWTLEQELQASDGVVNDQFGLKAVAIHGDTILVSAHQEVGATSYGKAYAFHRSGTTWAEEAIFVPDGTLPDYLHFGGSLAIDGDTALVSSAQIGFDVYVYIRDIAGTWLLATKITKRNPTLDSCFGCSVSLKGNVAVIGAPDFDWSPPGVANGNAYFYERIGSNADWFPMSYPDSSYDESFGFFLGKDVAMGDGKALVSADGGSGQVLGSVYLFTPPGPGPAPVITLSPTDMPTEDPLSTSGYWCSSGLFGDPHISTFDDLRFDCQAAGEFVMVKSDDLSFQVQERFTAIDDLSVCAQTSVSTGVVVQDANAPTIQISTPRSGVQASPNTVNTCPIDFYVDGVAMALPAEGESKTYDGNSNVLDGWIQGQGHVTVNYWGEWIYIYNTDTQCSMWMRVEQSAKFGCHLAVSMSLPGTFRPTETLFGLLGTCNYDSSDDWRAPDGTILSPPATAEDALFSTSYNYCVDNWCVHNQADSIFSYGVGESFSDIYKCNVAYINNIESQVAAPQELIDTCGSSVACMVDGLCGDMSDAVRALEIEALINATENGPPADWEIFYNTMIADFSVDSVNELSLNYDISVNREFETEIFEKDCLTPITDIAIIRTSAARSPKTAFHDSLVLTYDIDKAAIASSNQVWNSDTNQLELCQVVRLIIPETGSDPKMEISFDNRVMSVGFDLSVNFEFENGLGEGAVGEGSGSTNMDSFVEACRCDGAQSFTCLPPSEPLLPNDELLVCIRSVSSDVKIDFLDSMFVTQDPSTNMNVIMNAEVVVASITSIEYVSGMNGVAVSTRVPANIISFSAGQSITISGTIELKLDGTPARGRKLELFARPNPSVKELEEMASYQIKVDLAPREMVTADEFGHGNSASFVNSMAFAVLGVIFVFVHMIW